MGRTSTFPPLRALWRVAALALAVIAASLPARAQTSAPAPSAVPAGPTAPSAPAPADAAPGAGGETEPAPAAPSPPQPPPLSAADLKAIEEIRQPVLGLKTTVETLEKAVERNLENDEELRQLRVELLGLIDGAQLALDTLKPKADALRQQVEKLGPAPVKDAAPEAEPVAGERARLAAMVAEVDGALKTSELVQVRARQLLATTQTARQGLFARQLLKRTPSPLLTGTWEQLAADVPSALRQFSYAVSTWRYAASGKGALLAGLLAGVAAVFAALTWLVRRFLAYRLDRPRETPPGFFQQAAAVGWIAPLLAVPTLAALVLAGMGLEALGLLILDVGQIAQTAFPALLLFAAVSAFTRAILSPRRPAWRVVNLSTPTAQTLTRIVTGIAAVFAADVIVQETLQRLYLPLSITIMASALASIAIALLLIRLVRTPFHPKPELAGALPETRADGAVAGAPALPAMPSILSPRLIKLLLLAIASAILVLSLSGYIALGQFLTTQVVVTGSAVAVVLVMHLAIRALLGAPGTGLKPLSTVLKDRAGLEPGQAHALTRLLSIVLNGALALVAMPLILVTWGYSLSEALSWLGAAVFGFQIGEFRISVARIFLAIALFLALVFATRLIQRWLDTGVLASRRLDQGIANSIRTAVGYAGFAIAVLAAVSYGGLDITNLAIVAGALSVGIGFGLQSIVNNFVSGLILLVERPIKVGDRVAVKGQEGFVRRISVRSTEIETADKASLIVPNSDLVTSTVTNWTHRNALGTVTVRVPVSYRADPEQVRQILQSVGAACPLVLQHPAPSVSLDNFGPNGLDFALGAVIPDVTKAGAVQTDLRFRILQAFREAGIEMPYAQHDVHLRDLDAVRTALSRLVEERMRQAQGPTVDGKPTK